MAKLKIMQTPNFKYNKRYLPQKELALVHALNTRTISRWIADAKGLGQTIPGRIKIKGHQSYIWDPVIFHEWRMNHNVEKNEEKLLIYQPTQPKDIQCQKTK
jgi:hypothetical protein